MDKTRTLRIVRNENGNSSELTDTLASETHLKIFLNDRLVSLNVCTPGYETELAVGYLYSGKFLDDGDEIEAIRHDPENDSVYVHTFDGQKTVGPASGPVKIVPASFPTAFIQRFSPEGMGRETSRLVVGPEEILRIASAADAGADLFHRTGGTHSAAVSDGGRLLLLFEDLGRHNALDKAIGRCIIDGIARSDKILFTSGRVSTVVTGKAVRASFPMLVSKSAVTAESVDLARDHGLTLIGFARQNQFNVYCHGWRVQRSDGASQR
jgi:FdhD protein